MRGLILVAAVTMLAGGAIAGGSPSSSGSGSATAHITFAKRAEIGFAPGADAISPIVRSQIARVAAVLKSDLAAAHGRVEVEAYAPTHEARVLAVQRAVDVRLALVENGVPAEVIDVRVVPREANGGGVDTVSIYIHRPWPNPPAPN